MPEIALAQKDGPKREALNKRYKGDTQNLETRNPMTQIRLLAYDPGSSNSGYCLVDFTWRGQKVTPKIVKNGLMHSLIRDLKNGTAHAERIVAFLTEVKTHLFDNGEKPKAVIAERYMTRGINGPTVEYVNQMLGATAVILSHQQIPYKFIPASQWKNEVSRQGVALEELYVTGHNLDPRVTPHQIDAMMLCCYLFQLLAKMKVYAAIEKQMIRLIMELRVTATAPPPKFKTERALKKLAKKAKVRERLKAQKLKEKEKKEKELQRKRK